ncbi:CRAL-TRIO domain-containing protein [Talaromyces proteolyticus]|uniref:CRAL-TRIO domain-containing protein n=1 Tax=Talaromyces proteolyticus TaxID=1131652 RepID=A0AAD4PZ52_9EURO|nr:CRAL-TRIO domain-containing protein [Talaromyces proteolyticus]KAH8695412.1 CRAL-TRIO domain-containing protein [Talaromyces proteolyticus]
MEANTLDVQDFCDRKRHIQKLKSEIRSPLVHPVPSILTEENDGRWSVGLRRLLRPEQQDRFIELKELCRRHGLYNSKEDDDMQEAILLNFLRARKFDVTSTFDQFNLAVTELKKLRIHEFYENMDLNSYEETRNMYPQWTGRRDYDGLPVYVLPLSHLTKDRIENYFSTLESCSITKKYSQPGVSAARLHFHAFYQNLINFVTPLCSELPRRSMEIPVTASTYIIDISGVSLKQFWGIRRYLQILSMLSTTYYPETLGRVFIIGMPSFFKSVWSAVSKWFDPVTRSKFHILSVSEDTSTLISFMDPSSLPIAYGGTLNWRYHDKPILDLQARNLINTLYPQNVEGNETPIEGPVVFQGGFLKCLGTKDGTLRRNISRPMRVRPNEEEKDCTACS